MKFGFQKFGGWDQLSGFLGHITRSLCDVGACNDEVIRYVLHCAGSCSAPGNRVIRPYDVYLGHLILAFQLLVI